MTRFRYPNGWNTRREPGERPRIEGTWLAPERRPKPGCTPRYRRSYEYWSQIHWATPPWMTDGTWQQVREIYESAVPGLHEVDHIVPLKHPLVCGLNVPWNLEVVSKTVNQQKSNNHWPGCPDHLCPDRNLPDDMFGFNGPHQMRLAL